MKRALVLLAAVVLLVSLFAGSAGAQDKDTKWVRGKVTAVSADSVTVSVHGKEMKFAVDQATKVIADAGGTVKLAELAKVGQGLQVRYHEKGMHAAEIRSATVTGAGESSDAEKSVTVMGNVTAVTPNSLTVKGSSEWTFAVDAKTEVTGPGVGTKIREMKAAGGKGATIADLVGKGDGVTVVYHELGDTKHAATVRITRRAPK
jgi:hypothetical protein